MAQQKKRKVEKLLSDLDDIDADGLKLIHKRVKSLRLLKKIERIASSDQIFDFFYDDFTKKLMDVTFQKMNQTSITIDAKTGAKIRDVNLNRLMKKSYSEMKINDKWIKVLLKNINITDTCVGCNDSEIEDDFAYVNLFYPNRSFCDIHAIKKIKSNIFESMTNFREFVEDYSIDHLVWDKNEHFITNVCDDASLLMKSDSSLSIKEALMKTLTDRDCHFLKIESTREVKCSICS